MAVTIKIDKNNVQVLDDSGATQLIPIVLGEDNKLFINHLPGLEPIKKVNGNAPIEIQLFNLMPENEWCSIRAIAYHSQLQYNDIQRAMAQLAKRNLVIGDFFYRRV